MARRLEGAGDFAGAQAALERAVQATPRSAELRGQVASFHLRRSQPDEAEKAARAALAIDEDNIEAHRALGLVFAGYADAAGARSTSPQITTYLQDAITHLERAAASAAPGDLVLHFTLGRLYLRTDQPSRGRRVAQPRRLAQSRFAAGASRAGAGARVEQQPGRRPSTRSRSSSTTSRASPRRWGSTRSRRASSATRRCRTPRRSKRSR